MYTLVVVVVAGDGGGHDPLAVLLTR